MNKQANLNRRKNHSVTRACPDFFSKRPACAWPSVRDLFVRDDDRGTNRSARVAQAKAICAQCPFKVECEEWASATNQRGIWGGTTEEERRQVKRRRVSYAA